MENQTQQNEILTKANAEKEEEKVSVKSETVKGVVLSTKDVEEYRAYKRRKIVEEIMAAMAKSGSGLMGEEDVQRVCERAIRLKQASIQLPSSKLAQTKKCLANINRVKKGSKLDTVKKFFSVKNVKNQKSVVEKKIRLDCVIGGMGEACVDVKMFEARYAIRNGAKELTVAITPSLIANGRYTEIRKELRKLVWASKKTTLKVWVDKTYPISTLGRLARLVSEVGAQYFCVPYFDGCERIRFDLVNGCKLQVSGVETLTQFKKMLAVGAGRILSDKAWDIYEEWMQETDKLEFAKPALLLRETESKPLPSTEEQWGNVPTVEPPKKQPLPVSKVVQSGALSEEQKEKGEMGNPDLKIL